MSYETLTGSRSSSSTMTEARIRTVMHPVAANFSAFVIAGHIDRDRALKWISDLTYLQLKECLEFFELQLNGRSCGLRYTVSSDGSVQQNSPSGGLDLYGLPAGTTVQLYAHLRDGTPQSVYDELALRGWGFNGRKMEAPESEHRAFSSEGYGISRVKLGTWP
jgi:hypothetical protein